MCPKNIEGTIYAMVMATWNLGSNISNILGGFVMEAFGVSSHNFDNLSYMVFLTNTLQLIPIFLINFVNTEKISSSIAKVELTDI